MARVLYDEIRKSMSERQKEREGRMEEVSREGKKAGGRERGKGGKDIRKKGKKEGV